VFGFPSPISFVETDSMEPQLEPGDGFIGIPKPLAGEIERGDVITFEAQAVGGGGLTTHRVVGETESGYITKGDANPFNDTTAGEPPVTESQIQLVVVQVNGQILVIPNVGQVTSGIKGFLTAGISVIGLESISAGNPGIVVGIIGLVLVGGSILYDSVTGDNIRTANRSVKRPEAIDSRLILLILLLVLSLPLLSVSMLPSGTDELTILSSERPNPDDPSIIEAGNYSEANVSIENSQPLPMVIIVEPRSEGIEVFEQVLPAASGETVTTRFRVWAPEETGNYVRSRSVSYYIHVLPTSWISFLHNIHPIVALVVTTGVILLPVAVAFLLFVGVRKITLRDTSR
jgi:signal peptidase